MQNSILLGSAASPWSTLSAFRIGQDFQKNIHLVHSPQKDQTEVHNVLMNYNSSKKSYTLKYMDETVHDVKIEVDSCSDNKCQFRVLFSDRNVNSTLVIDGSALHLFSSGGNDEVFIYVPFNNVYWPGS